MLNQTPTEVGMAKNPGSPSHKGVHGLERLKKLRMAPILQMGIEKPA